MELTEKTTVVDLPVGSTLVKVQQTDVKFFNEETDAVEVARLTGKVSISECRKYVKDLFEGNIYITKENVAIQFPVDTVSLLQLKQD